MVTKRLPAALSSQPRFLCQAWRWNSLRSVRTEDGKCEKSEGVLKYRKVLSKGLNIILRNSKLSSESSIKLLKCYRISILLYDVMLNNILTEEGTWSSKYIILQKDAENTRDEVLRKMGMKGTIESESGNWNFWDT